jgi:hypothetical protein
VVSYDQTTNKTACVDCPANCRFCVAFQGHTFCHVPTPGYYLKDDNSIYPCAEGCQKCMGASIEECTHLKSGFYFHDGVIAPCQDGCDVCNSDGDCSECKPGMFSKTIINQEALLARGVNQKFECESCHIENCRACTEVEKDQSSLLKIKERVCTMCETGYGKDSLGKCQKCGDGCDYCQHDYTRCISCGFEKILNPETGKCEAPPIQNCNSVDSKDMKLCTHCGSGFYLSSDNGTQSCVSCSKFDENCMYCRGPAARNTMFVQDKHAPIFDLLKGFKFAPWGGNNRALQGEIPSHIYVPNPAHPGIQVYQPQPVYQQPGITYLQPAVVPGQVPQQQQPVVIQGQIPQQQQQQPVVVVQNPAVPQQQQQQPVVVVQNPAVPQQQQQQPVVPAQPVSPWGNAAPINALSPLPYGQPSNTSNDNNEDGLCMSCPAGSFLKIFEGGKRRCTPCARFCKNCNGDTCFNCIHGYFTAEEKDGSPCEKCELAHCRYCQGSKACGSCKEGFYLTEAKTCEPCNKSCLTCNGPTGGDCTTCPLSKWKWQTEGSGKMNLSIGGDFRMPFLNSYGSKFKCIDKCPSTIREYGVREELSVDTFSRTCVFKPEYEHSRYNFNLHVSFFQTASQTTSDPSRVLLDGINSFWENYQRYIKTDMILYKEEAVRGTAKSQNHSEPCTFNGHVKEIISPYKETSYVCYCTEGHLGEQCEISAGLFISSQIHIAKTLQEINHSKPQTEQLLLMLQTLNKPKVDLKNLDAMTTILYENLNGKVLPVKTLNMA